MCVCVCACVCVCVPSSLVSDIFYSVCVCVREGMYMYFEKSHASGTKLLIRLRGKTIHECEIFRKFACCKSPTQDIHFSVV